MNSIFFLFIYIELINLNSKCTGQYELDKNILYILNKILLTLKNIEFDDKNALGYYKPYKRLWKMKYLCECVDPPSALFKDRQDYYIIIWLRIDYDKFLIINIVNQEIFLFYFGGLIIL